MVWYEYVSHPGNFLNMYLISDVNGIGDNDYNLWRVIASCSKYYNFTTLFHFNEKRKTFTATSKTCTNKAELNYR